MSALLASPEIAGPRVEMAAFVLGLRSRGVSDLGVLRAMETVPRDMFAPRRFADLAREDVALPLPCGETMTAPSCVGAMLAALGARPGQRVFEIGTGSGYVTALLIAAGATALSLERRPALAEAARHRVRALGLAAGAEIVCRDGLLPDDLRFDRILVNGRLPALPGTLTSRLLPGGRLVCGLAAAGETARLTVVTREADGRLETKIGAPIRLAAILVDATAGRATEA